MTDAALLLPPLPALPPGLRWRVLGAGDIDPVERLHRAALAGVSPSIVKPETHGFLASILNGRGRAIGLEDVGGSLVAYGFLQQDLLPEDDPREKLGLTASTPIAKLAGVAVTPERRGAGLQRLIIRARVAIADRQQVLFSTASPLNPASWISLLDEGFLIRRLEYRYGGHARFLHVREPNGARVLPAGEARDVDGDDIATHAELLRHGWVGVEAVPASPRVRYRQGALA